MLTDEPAAPPIEAHRAPSPAPARTEAARTQRVALVHDWLNQRGGAENVLQELAGLFPGAPVYTSMADASAVPEVAAWPVMTTFMQNLPGVTRSHQRYLPIYPLAFASLDLSGYDLVLSNKSGFCHGVRTAREGRRARHVCYCLTPTRFLWLFDQYRERESIGRGAGLLLQPLVALLRRWDYAAAQRVDEFIAISRTVQERILSIYGRDSVVIYPPVDTDFFTPDPAVPQGDFYLIVSRLIPYKRIDLAVDAFRRLPGRTLVIVGEGRDLAALRAQAPPNVHFLGRQDNTVVRDLMRRCAAFLFPGLEDFGIAPVEAMACGRPVIAFAGGGALDTIVDGQTGAFFAEQTVESLVATLGRFDVRAVDPAACRAQAERFSRAEFRARLLAYLDRGAA